MILVNFKIYKESFGEGAVKLAKICKKVSEKAGVEIIPVVSALDAFRIKNELNIRVFLQSVDEKLEGAFSGSVSPSQAKELGIGGCVINHSEKKLKPGTIKGVLKRWPDGFVSVLCLQTLGQAEGWAKNLKPDLIAYEPSYLIGNKEKSVSTEKSGDIKKLVELYKQVPVLAGAGIKSEEDVRVAISMGAKGILVSSAVVKSDDPEKELLKLSTGFIV